METSESVACPSTIRRRWRQHELPSLFNNNNPLVFNLLFVYCCLFSSYWPQVVQGYGWGAPTLACNSLTPDHGFAPQTSPSPFAVIPQQNTVEPGGKVNVRLASTQPFVTFKGFLLEAVDPLSSIQRTVGNFAYPTTSSARILSCSDDAHLGGDDGHQQQKVTHANSKAKTTLDFIWEAPADYKGDVLFRSTFVKDFMTFWVRVPSSNGTVRVGQVDVTVDSCKNGAPSVSSSNFEVINSRLEQRTAIVRWSLQRPSECRPIGSSSSRGYEIYLLDMKGNTLATKRVDSGNTTSATFENLVRQEAYKFVILPNQNKFDSSLNDYLPLPINSSLQHHVFLPTSFNMPPPPENVIRMTHNETLFEIRWSPPAADSSLISHYTVYWCRSRVRRDSVNPVHCQGELYSQDVGAGQEIKLNVTVLPATDANYEFAVAAIKDDHSSSGIIWSTPFILADMRQLIVDVVQRNSSTLQVSWSLPCSAVINPLGGIITGFNIYYCPVVELVDGSSKCLSNNSTPALISIRTDPNVNNYAIDGLEPNTLYKISMSVETRLGESESSSPFPIRIFGAE